jgi:hypothetical protein
MQLFTHRSHLDALPESPLKKHIIARYDDLVETEDDIPPIFIIVEDSDAITGPDYAFIGNRGLLTDLFGEHEPGHPEFARPYEWASYLPPLKLYEVLLLTASGEDGYLILIPEAVVEAQPDLKWVLTDEHQGGLSDPQPLY